MKLAVCLDDRGGMCFGGRRQSKDICQREDLLTLTAPGPLWMSPYSAAQFEMLPDFVKVDEEYLKKAQQDDWCFVEREDVSAVEDSVTQVAIYRWNRHYPSDRKFPTSLFENRWYLVSRREFPGKSHDLITLEVYAL
jgi:hypothetical protein